MTMRNKLIITIIALSCVLCVLVSGTIAWLTAKTAPITYTFVTGNIRITLSETTGEKYTMSPGATIEKNPTVTVAAGSEACWLFVKVDESANLDSFIAYAMADGWTALNDANNDGIADDDIYYREVPTSAEEDQEFPILKVVNVKESVTDEMLNNLDESTYPTLTFTAYAIQSTGIADTNDNNTAADEAWVELNASSSEGE